MKESLWQANTCPTIVLGDVDCVHEERDRATNATDSDCPLRGSPFIHTSLEVGFQPFFVTFLN
jgi:hypothetical protein